MRSLEGVEDGFKRATLEPVFCSEVLNKARRGSQGAEVLDMRF